MAAETGIARQTLSKWAGRYRRRGRQWLDDRRSRPRRSPRQTVRRTEVLRTSASSVRGITAVYVTHDRTEALSISDRIGLMQDGKIVQNDTPDVVWNRPRSRYVADFLGMPGLLECEWVSSHGTEAVVRVGSRQITATVHDGTRELVDQGTDVCLLLDMPEVTLAKADTKPDVAPGVNRLDGTVVARSLVGDYIELDVRIGSETVRVRREKGRVSVEVGEQLHLEFTPGHAQILTSSPTPRDEVVRTGTSA